MRYAQGISEAKPASVTVDESILQYKKFSDLFLCLYVLIPTYTLWEAQE